MAKDSIKDAITVAVKEQTSIGVVTTKTDAGYRVMGVVPERLLVEELINFRGTIHQMGRGDCEAQTNDIGKHVCCVDE
jgi:ABC-type Na+ transport system ATPase subunit NatA